MEALPGGGTHTHKAAVLAGYWTNLAKYGTPNGGDGGAYWPPYDAAGDQHMELALPLSAKSGHRHKQNQDIATDG